MKPNFIYQRVGTTRSGKMIISVEQINHISQVINHIASGDFSTDDLLDVIAVFEYLAVRSMRRKTDYEIYSRLAEVAWRLIDKEELAQAKIRAGVDSAFKLRDLGRLRTELEFRDF